MSELAEKGRKREDISMKIFQYEEQKERNQKRWAEYQRFVELSLYVMEVPEREERAKGEEKYLKKWWTNSFQIWTTIK